MKFVFLFVALISGAQSFGAAKVQCGKDTLSNVEFSWCVRQDLEAPTNQDVIYAMHGGGGTVEDMASNDFYAQFAPTILTFSFGKTWLLTDMPSGQEPGLLTVALNEIMPFLENKIGGVKGRRFLVGHSMGGYNGAELALRAPERFSRVALLCPGLAVVDPFSPPEVIEKYIAQQPKGIEGDYIRGTADWIRQEFQTPENWARHDPMQLVTNAVKLNPEFFVSCTRLDEYGFFPGAKRFTEEAAKKTKAQWFPIEEGGHCEQTIESRAALKVFFAAPVAQPAAAK